MADWADFLLVAAFSLAGGLSVALVVVLVNSN